MGSSMVFIGKVLYFSSRITYKVKLLVIKIFTFSYSSSFYNYNNFLSYFLYLKIHVELRD